MMKKVIVVMSIIIIGVWFLMSALIASVEGGQEPYATPTAPLPTCSDAGVACFTPTPNGHWINPIPWPTYSPPDAYPAPDPTSEPPGYPDYHMAPSIPFEETKHYTADSGSGLADSLWAWILDLFTH